MFFPFVPFQNMSPSHQGVSGLFNFRFLGWIQECAWQLCQRETAFTKIKGSFFILYKYRDDKNASAVTNTESAALSKGHRTSIVFKKKYYADSKLILVRNSGRERSAMIFRAMNLCVMMLGKRTLMNAVTEAMYHPILATCETWSFRRATHCKHRCRSFLDFHQQVALLGPDLRDFFIKDQGF